MNEVQDSHNKMGQKDEKHQRARCENPLHDASSKASCIVDYVPLNWCTDCFYNGIKNGKLPWRLIIEDKTMQNLYELAEELGPSPSLPNSLMDPCDLARFLDYVDKEIIPLSHTVDFENDVPKQQEFLARVEELTIEKIPDVQDGNIRKNLTLRLWAGAMTLTVQSVKALAAPCPLCAKDFAPGQVKKQPT